MSSPRWGHKLAAILVSGLVLVAVAGCGYRAEVPDVVWPDGEPSGPWEDDPWVQAVRESELQNAIATVTLDYTSEALANSMVADSVRSNALQRQGLARNERWFYLAGPRPMTILGVEESVDGRSAIVEVCQFVSWIVDPDQPEPPEEIDGRPGQRQVFLDDDGHRRVDYYGGGKGEVTCDLSNAARGYFDPMPDPHATFAPESVRVPAE